PVWIRFAIAFLGGLAIALLCYGIGTFAATLVVMAVAAGDLGVSVALLSRINICLPVFVPLAIAPPSGYLFSLWVKLVHYKLNRAGLRDILGKFVPQQVRHLFEENTKRLEHLKQTSHAACVITDIEGFTALSAKLSSERVLALLGDYFGAILEPIARYGG